MRFKIIGLFILVTFVFIAKAEKQDSIGQKVIKGKNYTLHKVSAGETLYGISRKYHAKIENIKLANPNFNTLRGGDTLLIPAKLVIKAPAIVKRKVKGHTVVAGETLYSISKQYKTTVDEIKRLNNLKNNSVSLGQLVLVAAPETNLDTATKKNEIIAIKVPKNDPKITIIKKDPVIKNTKKEVVLDGMVNESGMAKIAKSEKLDPQRNYILHPKAKIGSIVELVNPKNNKAVFARVVGAFNVGLSSNENIALYISQKTAKKLGIPNEGGTIMVKYRK